MSTQKSCISVFALTLTIGIISPIIVGKLYPFTNISFTLGILLTIILAWRDPSLHQVYSFYVSIITVLAILYRLRIFLYPASLIGFDPDGYAIQMTRVIESGDISSITFGFYSQAPFHFLEGIMASLITGLSTPMANLVFPILGGAVVPLLAASFAQRLRPSSPKTTVLAAGGASILGYTVEFSYSPIAQTTGVLFLGITIFSLLVYSSRGDRRWLALALLTMVGSLYTHKLSAIAITVSITGAIFLGLLHPKTRRSSAVRRLGIGVLGLFTVLTIVQLQYVTGFVTPIIFQLAVPNAPTVAAAGTPTSAYDPYSLGDRLFRLSYVLLLAVLAGLVWITSLWRTLRTETDHQIVLFLGFVAPLAGLAVLLYPAGINPVRAIFYSETLLFVLLAVGLYWPIVKTPNSSQKAVQLGAIGVALLLITMAGVSPIAGPDWGKYPRGYLTTEEVEAKEWGYDRIAQTVATDQFYAHETPPDRITKVQPERGVDATKFEPQSILFLNNGFHRDSPSVVAHRTCIEVFRSNTGIWKPSYSIEVGMNKHYGKIYTSGCVKYNNK